MAQPAEDLNRRIANNIANDQPEAIDLAKIKKALRPEVVKELEAAFTRKKDIADGYTAAVEAKAMQAGVHASVLKAYIKARVEGKQNEYQEKMTQTQLLFEELKA